MTHGHFPGCLRFSFAELKKPAIDIFSRNLHLLSFPTIYSLPCFPLKWRPYEFFPEGHKRSPAKVRRNLNLVFVLQYVHSSFSANDTCMGLDCDPNAVCDPFRGCLCKPGYQGDGTNCEGKQTNFLVLVEGVVFESQKLGC